MSQPSFRRIGLPLLFLILAGFLLVQISSHRAVNGSSDFDTYYFAGRSVLEDKPIYTVARHAVNLSKSPFVYPPFFAYLISSLTLLPISWAASLWNFLNVFFFLGSLVLLHRLLADKEGKMVWFQKPALFWKGVFWVLALSVLIDNLVMAQVNIFVFFLILLAIERYLNKQEIESGFWLGVASAIKLIPLIFLFYFLIKRKWNVCVGGFIAFVLCFWLFPLLTVGAARSTDHSRAWVDETIRDQTEPRTLGFYSTQLNPSHQNLQAVVFRWVIDWEFRERTGGPNGRAFLLRTPIRLSEVQAGHAARAASGLLFLVLCLALIGRKREGEKSKDVFLSEIGCLLSAMVLLSPKMRSHFFVFLIFPWAMLVRSVVQGKNRKVIRAAKRTLIASALFYCLQGFRYLKFLGAGAFSALALFIFFAATLLKRREVPAVKS